MKKSSTASISLFALVMLMTGAVDGVGNMPSIAIFGQQLVFFFIVASLIFLLPVGLIAAELCAQYPNEGGVYHWAKKSLGSPFASLVIWLQWINTLIWFPTCLTTLVGTLAYLIDPILIQSPVYLVSTSLIVFWLMTFLNLKGIKKSSKIAAIATGFGMLLPMAVIIGLSVLWLVFDKPLALHINHTALLPNLMHTGTWTSLTAIITAFLGIELATVHVKKVKNAQQVFPKALVLTVLIIVFTMGLGSLGVALVIPHQNIALVAGTVQAFNALFIGFHIPWMEKALGFLLIFGSLGTMVNWLISPANGLAQAAHDGYLPKKLASENQHGVPHKLLLLQAIVVSVVSFAFFMLPSVNGSYWFLLDLSTEIYVMMYFLMFISAFKLVKALPTIKIIPGGKKVAFALTILGMLGTAITLVVGFFPPSGINVGGGQHYVVLFGGSVLFLMSPVLLLNWHKAKFLKPLTIEKD